MAPATPCRVPTCRIEAPQRPPIDSSHPRVILRLPSAPTLIRQPRSRAWASLIVSLGASNLLAACTEPAGQRQPRTLGSTTFSGWENPRINGPIVAASARNGGFASLGRSANGSTKYNADGRSKSSGDITLNFANTDIRSATDQILSAILHENYLIDPSVHGTVTLRTARPLRREQVLDVFRSALAASGASLIEENGLFRVTSAGNSQNGSAQAEVTLIPLRYVSGDSLVRALTPLLHNNGRIVASPGGNTVAVSGDPATRASLAEMVRTFDTDILAGQSYAIFPTTSGSAQELAQALQSALLVKQGKALYDRVQIVPMPRIEAVMVIGADPRFVSAARRAFDTIEAQRRRTLRRWNIYYLQNNRANDVAYLLQQAFTPDHVTAQPSAKMDTSSNNSQNTTGNNGGNSATSFGGTGQTGQQSSSNFGLNTNMGTGNASVSRTGGASDTASSAQGTTGDNPLLGGLGSSASAESTSSRIRIIPDLQNNAILTYGTVEENDVVTAMLRKVDIMPLQVRVDATVAEVDLNDNLKYGTQFIFKSGGINGLLSNASGSIGAASLASAALSTSFPGFVIGGASGAGAPFVINALQDITNVRVLSSPELMVVDNQPASLMVGDAVPYLSGTTTGVLTTNSTITNQINYQNTGVILQITPHISNGGLVTLDLSQTVSSVASYTTSTGSGSINSPTFSQRQVSSRVVIADGQTVGLAGLISDRSSHENSGIPWLKNVPLLGLLGGTQTNTRTRTELLVLITPHVIHNQADALSLTEDLRDMLPRAAAAPRELDQMPISGHSDPQHRLLKKIGLHD